MKFLLLDFDGPVCSVFAGFPAPDVAQRLREYLRSETPDGWMSDNDDPHAVLRASSDLGTDIATRANQELSNLEIEAVKTAEPTPYATDVIDHAKAVGSKLAIVSNNAQAAIVSYLANANLLGSVDYVSGRSMPDPKLMKPDPYLVIQAMSALNADTKTSALVGDQLSDIVAAHRAGIKAIGYANKNGKEEKFKQAAADLVITSMSELIPFVLST